MYMAHFRWLVCNQNTPPDLCECEQHHVLASERSASCPRHIAHVVQSFFNALGVDSCREHELLHLHLDMKGNTSVVRILYIVRALIL